MIVVKAYLVGMPIVPAARPNSARILALIKDSGYPSIAEFARNQRRLPVSTLYNVCHSGQRASLDYFDKLAVALGVDPEELILDDDADAPSAA